MLEKNTPYQIMNRQTVNSPWYIAQPGAWLYIGPSRNADTQDHVRMESLGNNIILETHPENIQPASLYVLHHGLPSIATLATEAAILYRLDPARIQRAYNILLKGRIIAAKRDQYGEIPPTARDIRTRAAVLSQTGSGWYEVSRKKCSCHDSDIDGNVCKHRIAVWMLIELQDRPARIQAASQRARQLHREMAQVES